METEPVSTTTTTEPQLEPIIVIKPTKATDDFEAHMAKLHAIFLEASDRVIAELKDDIKSAENYAVFVVRAMQAVADADIHGDEKKRIVIDIVHKIVDSMPISEEARQQVKDTNYELTSDMIDLMIGAAKGYMYLKQKLEAALDADDSGCGCFGKKTAAAAAPKAARDDPAAAGVPVSALFDVNLLVDEVYDTIKGMVRHQEITLVNIVTIGTTCMQVVEQYPQLTGYQKKQLVLRVLHNLIDEDPNLDPKTRATLKLAIDTTVSMAINFIVKAANGEIELLNKIVAAVERKCGACCGGEAAEPVAVPRGKKRFGRK